MASRASTSTSASSPTPPLSISPLATVSDKAILTGAYIITISAGAVINPFARLDSTHGPIFVDEDVVIWERAVVGAMPSSSSSLSTNSSEGIKISDSASIHPLAQIAPGVTVGSCGDVGVHAIVHAGAFLGAYVTVSPYAQVEAGEKVEDYTAVFLIGSEMVRRKGVIAQAEGGGDAETFRELREKGHEREVGMLRRIVKGGVKWVSGDGIGKDGRE